MLLRGLLAAVACHPTLRASLSGTFLQTLQELVTPQKGHSFISAQLSADSVSAIRFGYSWDCGSNFVQGAGIAQWLERRTRDWKVAGSKPCRSGGRISFSTIDFLCWLLFRYPFHPRVTAVARKRSRSFCQKCRWQVTAKHAYTFMYVALKWHGAWLYGVHRTCAETAAVSCGTSHASAVSTPLRWIYIKK